METSKRQVRYRLHFADYLGEKEDIGWISILNGAVTEHPYRKSPFFNKTSPRTYQTVTDYVNSVCERNAIPWNKIIPQFGIDDFFLDDFPEWVFEIKVQAITLLLEDRPHALPHETLKHFATLPSIKMTLTSKQSTQENNQIVREVLIRLLTRLPEKAALALAHHSASIC